MTDPAHKKRIRWGHKASATKMLHKAEEFLSQDTVDYAQLAKIRLSLQEKVSVLKHAVLLQTAQMTALIPPTLKGPAGFELSLILAASDPM